MARKSSISTNFCINKKFNYHSFKDNSPSGNYKLGNFLEEVLRENLSNDISLDIHCGANNSELNINFLIKKEYLKSHDIFEVEKHIDNLIKKAINYLKSFPDDVKIWEVASITDFKGIIKNSLILEEQKMLEKVITKKSNRAINQKKRL